MPKKVDEGLRDEYGIPVNMFVAPRRPEQHNLPEIHEVHKGDSRIREFNYANKHQREYGKKIGNTSQKFFPQAGCGIWTLVIFGILGTLLHVGFLPFMTIRSVEKFSQSWWVYSSVYWAVLAMFWILFLANVISAARSVGRRLLN